MKRIGIDLGGTNIVSAVIESQNGCHKVIGKAFCKTKAPRETESICDDMIGLCQKALEKSGSSFNEIESIGIGIPGSVDPENGVVNFASNLFVENWNIVDMMRKCMCSEKYSTDKELQKLADRVDIFIENDANAAAYGEFLAGGAKNSNNSVMITLGTGIGGGIIIDKKIYSASNYAAGELGHMVIVKDGKQCNCGRKGCWEVYASATALLKLTIETMKNHPESYMWEHSQELRKVTGKTPFESAILGDESAIKVINTYVEYLACGAANVINIFQPDCLVVGGGVSNQGEYLLAPLRKCLEGQTYSKNLKQVTKIVKAELGNDAGLIGAALLGAKL